MKYDAITLEIFWNRLIAILDEQATGLIRTSFTPLVREAQDLSCGLFDVRGNMMAQATIGTPGHINTMAAGVKHFLKKYPAPKLCPGDILITNDPWLVSGHKHDITVVTPIFKDKRLVALTASTCHVIDIGGMLWGAEAREVQEEGLAIPIMKLYDRGKPNATLFKIIEENVRVPQLVIGDIQAQVAGNEIGAARVLEFMHEYRLEELEELSDQILAISEKATREAIQAVPDGAYRDRVTFDGFDEPLTIEVTITIDGSSILVDYTGTSPQSERGINVVYNYTYAMTSYAIKSALCPDVPNNDGSFRPIEMVAPPGCLLNAQFPAPVAARHLTGHYCVPAIYGALARVIPDKVLSDSSAVVLAQFAGEGFVANYFGSGGMGARPTKDGLSAVSHPSNTANSPIEIVEAFAPLVVKKKELIADSGGPGKYRGGCGQSVVVSLLGERAATLTCLCERIKFPARGMMGGRAGAKGQVFIDGQLVDNAKRRLAFSPGQELVLNLAGGGGFFAPEDRDPNDVLADVLEGLVSAESATNDYKVVLTPDGNSIDWQATARLRALKGDG